jgi:hypothetical protein
MDVGAVKGPAEMFELLARTDMPMPSEPIGRQSIGNSINSLIGVDFGYSPRSLLASKSPNEGGRDA